MLFVSDQHHLHDLEKKVIKVYGSSRNIRLIGDMSPTQILGKDDKLQSTLLKQERNQRQEILKSSTGIFHRVSRTEHIIRMDTLNILEADDEKFNDEWVCLYGSPSISSLARKCYVSEFSSNPVICLKGSETIVDNAQNAVYERIMRNQGFSKDLVTPFILDNIKRKNPYIRNVVFDQIREVKGDIDIGEFIISALATENYKGKIPTVSDIFRSRPCLDNFDYVESISWEKIDNCLVVYVPYFYQDTERKESEEKIHLLEDFISENQGIPIIASHGNPYPAGMDDEEAQSRIEYNSPLIENIARMMISTLASGRGKDPLKLICGHLHKENKPYDWPMLSDSKIRKTVIYPLGIRDIACLDTNTGDIKVERYS